MLTYQLISGDDLVAIAAFLSAHEWPFHAGGLSPGRSARRYVGDDVRSHWIVEDDERIGLIRVDDLNDGPLLDLRIGTDRRGRGLGTAALRWVTADVFTTTSQERFEATTRVDNVAMRAALRRCGWVKEAHYRRAWPTPDSADGLLDSVGYAILLSDWKSGRVSPVDFADEPVD